MDRSDVALAAVLAAAAIAHTQRRRRWPYDLFGQVAVTWLDIDLWMERVAPHVSPPRREYYIRWNGVIDKIQREKIRGTWPPEDTRRTWPPTRFVWAT